MHDAVRLRDDFERVQPLTDPVLLAAFSGWGDMGGSSVATLEYLAEHWAATIIAEVDEEPFLDFTVHRPRVRLQAEERVIDWPRTRFMHARPAGAERDFVLLVGPEPNMRWRTFTEAIEAVMRALGATTSITLGAQPAAVPHTRPLPVTLSASHPDFEQQFGLKSPASRYQGPTGIVGVMNVHHRSLHWRNASLWALSPHYVTVGPNPNVTMTLVRALDRGFHTRTPIEPLEARIAEFSVQVEQALRESADAAGYVRQLEAQYDASQSHTPQADRPAAPGSELPAAADLLDDLERFLRDRRPGDD